MKNQPNQIFAGQENQHTQHHGAHSGSHAGGSEYHDGEELSPSEDKDFDGQIAYGNDNEASEAEEDEYGKYHSGL